MNQRLHKIISVLIVLLVPLSAAAAEGFEYPELLVAPRASDRLEMEAKAEPGYRWSTHIPIQISALATLTAGILQSGNVDTTKDESSRSPIAGIAVGGSWLVASFLLASAYHPYETAWSEVRPLPKGSPREQLVRERISEEALERAAALSKRLTWISAASNFGAGLYMLTQARSGTAAQVADGVAMAAALTPLIFPHRWQTVACEQQEYKKRIYAPIASLGALSEPVTNRPAPGLSLSLSF